MQAMLGLCDEHGVKPDHKDAIIFSIDMEWFSRGGQFPPLEFGLAALDTRDVYDLDPTQVDDFEYFKPIKATHLRFKESGHIENKAPWLSQVYNNAEGFQYGRSGWVSREQIEEAFKKLAHIPDDRKPGEFRKMHVITQGGDTTDFKLLGDFAKPAFDAKAKVPNLTTEELQETSKDAMSAIYKACGGRKPFIETILKHVGLERLELHNAGNDAVAQLAAAVKLSLKEYRERPLQADEPEEEMEVGEPIEGPIEEMTEEMNFKAGVYDVLADLADIEEQVHCEDNEVEDKSVQAIVEESIEPTGTLLTQLSQHLQSRPQTASVGSLDHCTRCGSDAHPRQQCDHKGFIECKRCLKRWHHVTLHCPFRGGRDSDEWLENRRRSNYNHYWELDQQHGRRHKAYVSLRELNLTENDNIFEGQKSRAAMAKLEEELAFQATMRGRAAFPELAPTLAAFPSSRNPSPTSDESVSSVAEQKAASRELSASMWAKVKIPNHKAF